ncbi:MAG: hypothetical protein BGO78_18080 [Chloroflexi bacterium 44-23]|nr:MAG: hypothetical protein BGO78_18080 [Chloroflexi bacterium 44-23]
MAAKIKIKKHLLMVILLIIFTGSLVLFLTSIWPQSTLSTTIPFPVIRMEEFQLRIDPFSNG